MLVISKMINEVVEKLLWKTSLAVRSVKIETDANLKNVTHHDICFFYVYSSKTIILAVSICLFRFWYAWKLSP